MTNPFREAICDVRTDLTREIDVSDLLLGELQAREVLTDEQYDEIRVRCFTSRRNNVFQQ